VSAARRGPARRWAASAALLLFALLVPAAPAAAFGIDAFEVAALESNATPTTQAGAHPYALQAELALDTEAGAQRLRNLTLALPPGLLVNPEAVPECLTSAFHTPRSATKPTSLSGESCPDPTQVGVIEVDVGGVTRHFGLFNLSAPFGTAAAIGASPFGAPLLFEVVLREADSGLDLRLREVPSSFDLRGITLTLWGTPWWGNVKGEESHDPQRGNCLNEETGGSLASDCQVKGPGIEAPASQVHSYLTLPTSSCGPPPAFSAKASGWAGASDEAAATIPAMEDCNEALTIPKVALMSDGAAARSGLAFDLDVNDGGGITNPGGIARPPIGTAIASLPEGLTINPSLGAGLGTCAEAQWGRESAGSEPGAGCPNSSKIGTATLNGALGIEEAMQGSVYLATPNANPFGSLIALYMLARSPRRGLIVKSQGKLEPDPRTGRLVATFEELPRLLYTHFELTLREGQRSALVSPPACGSYVSDLAIASWAQPTLFSHVPSSFLITRGAGGGPCPTGGIPPFAPGLIAGSLNPTAKTYTPYYLRMTRSDAEQEITSYSATFPPGLLGKIAGVPFCPEAAIERARGRSGIEEREGPSCPAASQIGRTEAGYGVGGVLAWAPGNLYLAGPYNGAPLSVVAVDSALVGPFDLGVVIVRSAIRVNPRSAQVSIDSAGSDPIPHILRGIPLHLRDIRVYVERPQTMLTPTSCDKEQALSTLTGAGADPFSPTDESTATTTQRYQVLGCSALGFKPKLSFKLKGGTHRGRFPTLITNYKPRARDANLRSVAVTLPRSLFLEQRHIGTVCTRPEYRQDRCPARSVYGSATAITPLLDEPLTGPVILRASDHALPDIVAKIQGRGVEIEAVGRISKGHEGIRASFEALPDGPVTRFQMKMNGGKHGILVNSANACEGSHKAEARYIGHNAETYVQKAPVKASCGGKGKAKGKDAGGKR
jgi:hypothetical protein